MNACQNRVSERHTATISLMIMSVCARLVAMVISVNSR